MSYPQDKDSLNGKPSQFQGSQEKPQRTPPMTFEKPPLSNQQSQTMIRNISGQSLANIDMQHTMNNPPNQKEQSPIHTQQPQETRTREQSAYVSEEEAQKQDEELIRQMELRLYKIFQKLDKENRKASPEEWDYIVEMSINLSIEYQAQGEKFDKLRRYKEATKCLMRSLQYTAPKDWGDEGAPSKLDYKIEWYLQRISIANSLYTLFKRKSKPGQIINTLQQIASEIEASPFKSQIFANPISNIENLYYYLAEHHLIRISSGQQQPSSSTQIAKLPQGGMGGQPSLTNIAAGTLAATMLQQKSDMEETMRYAKQCVSILLGKYRGKPEVVQSLEHVYLEKKQIMLIHSVYLMGSTLQWGELYPESLGFYKQAFQMGTALFKKPGHEQATGQQVLLAKYQAKIDQVVKIIQNDIDENMPVEQLTKMFRNDLESQQQHQSSAQGQTKNSNEHLEDFSHTQQDLQHPKSNSMNFDEIQPLSINTDLQELFEGFGGAQSRDQMPTGEDNNDIDFLLPYHTVESQVNFKMDDKPEKQANGKTPQDQQQSQQQQQANKNKTVSKKDGKVLQQQQQQKRKKIGSKEESAIPNKDLRLLGNRARPSSAMMMINSIPFKRVFGINGVKMVPINGDNEPDKQSLNRLTVKRIEGQDVISTLVKRVQQNLESFQQYNEATIIFPPLRRPSALQLLDTVKQQRSETNSIQGYKNFNNYLTSPQSVQSAQLQYEDQTFKKQAKSQFDGQQSTPQQQRQPEHVQKQLSLQISSGTPTDQLQPQQQSFQQYFSSSKYSKQEPRPQTGNTQISTTGRPSSSTRFQGQRPFAKTNYRIFDEDEIYEDNEQSRQEEQQQDVMLPNNSNIPPLIPIILEETDRQKVETEKLALFMSNRINSPSSNNNNFNPSSGDASNSNRGLNNQYQGHRSGSFQIDGRKALIIRTHNNNNNFKKDLQQSQNVLQVRVGQFTPKEAQNMMSTSTQQSPLPKRSQKLNENALFARSKQINDKNQQVMGVESRRSLHFKSQNLNAEEAKTQTPIPTDKVLIQRKDSFDVFEDEEAIAFIQAFDFDKVVTQKQEKIMAEIDERSMKDRENSLQKLEYIGPDNKNINGQNQPSLCKKKRNWMLEDGQKRNLNTNENRDEISSDEGEREQEEKQQQEVLAANAVANGHLAEERAIITENERIQKERDEHLRYKQLERRRIEEVRNLFERVKQCKDRFLVFFQRYKHSETCIWKVEQFRVKFKVFTDKHKDPAGEKAGQGMQNSQNLNQPANQQPPKATVYYKFILSLQLESSIHSGMLHFQLVRTDLDFLDTILMRTNIISRWGIADFILKHYFLLPENATLQQNWKDYYGALKTDQHQLLVSFDKSVGRYQGSFEVQENVELINIGIKIQFLVSQNIFLTRASFGLKFKFCQLQLQLPAEHQDRSIQKISSGDQSVEIESEEEKIQERKAIQEENYKIIKEFLKIRRRIIRKTILTMESIAPQVSCRFGIQKQIKTPGQPNQLALQNNNFVYGTDADYQLQYQHIKNYVERYRDIFLDNLQQFERSISSAEDASQFKNAGGQQQQSQLTSQHLQKQLDFLNLRSRSKNTMINIGNSSIKASQTPSGLKNMPFSQQQFAGMPTSSLLVGQQSQLHSPLPNNFHYNQSFSNIQNIPPHSTRLIQQGSPNSTRSPSRQGSLAQLPESMAVRNAESDIPNEEDSGDQLNISQDSQHSSKISIMRNPVNMSSNTKNNSEQNQNQKRSFKRPSKNEASNNQSPEVKNISSPEDEQFNLLLQQLPANVQLGQNAQIERFHQRNINKKSTFSMARKVSNNSSEESDHPPDDHSEEKNQRSEPENELQDEHKTEGEPSTTRNQQLNAEIMHIQLENQDAEDQNNNNHNQQQGHHLRYSQGDFQDAVLHTRQMRKASEERMSIGDQVSEQEEDWRASNQNGPVKKTTKTSI